MFLIPLTGMLFADQLCCLQVSSPSNAEVQKAQNQVGAHSIKKRSLKPHVGSDALMFGHAKKVQEGAGGISAAWNPIGIFNGSGANANGT